MGGYAFYLKDFLKPDKAPDQTSLPLVTGSNIFTVGEWSETKGEQGHSLHLYLDIDGNLLTFGGGVKKKSTNL